MPLIAMVAGCLVVGVLASQTAAIPAFPGAEGFGANATGGRGGDVYHVTSLADTNTIGTLRYGIANTPSGGRTILFDTAGTIRLTSTLSINKPNLTVAGQSAPGGGITLVNYQAVMGSSNQIVRNIRFRSGDTIVTNDDSLWLSNCTNSIVDHVSASWSLDEVLSTTNASNNVTVQWAVISEGLNVRQHGYGSLIRPTVNSNVSYLHNLYAHNYSRNPRPGSYSGATCHFDFRNNVIYNWGDQAGYGCYASYVPPEYLDMDYVGNYLIAGTNSQTLNTAFTGLSAAGCRIYQDGNKIDPDKDGVFDGTNTGWAMFAGSFTQMATAFAAGTVYTQTADQALASVLTGVGVHVPYQDSADARIIQDVYNGTGGTINSQNQVGGWPVLPGGSYTLGYDTDRDGMPNTWEIAHGLDPSAASNNGDYDADGYTNIEEYINELAAFPAPKTITYTGGTAGRYELITNWDIPWQPSTLDAAEINSGKATVGYIGQEAGTLYVGNTASSNGELAVTAGSLALANRLILGNATNATGTANLTGGSLTATGAIVLASASSSTGVLNVSKDAYVQVAGLTVNTGSGRSTRVGVELDGNTQSLIHTTGASTLGGVMDVQVLDGYRPREGDEFAVITSTDPNAVYFTGNFSTFTSNITYGLPPSSAAFGGGGGGGAVYELVFLGYTHGDANGDHSVNGGDLSLMGGNWMVSTTGWGNCDFNNDSLVDGGDLSLTGGNWNWSLPGGAPSVPIPEPATLALLALAAAALVRKHRR